VARYSLIMRDATYIVLVQEAVRRGISLGKLLNEILDQAAEEIKGGVVQQAICIACGRPAVKVGFGAGQQRLYVCALHQSQLRGLKGTRVIGERRL